ncbi:MAG: hypothetical protein HOE48_14845, partial [Candidatus Latescibacteria bacterium]|nr:hypothetical protein [Candidatus Latescibacterota bacterium]
MVVDLNDDGEVNFLDFVGFALSFGNVFSEPVPPISIASQIAYNAQTNTSQITLSFSQQIRIVTETSLSLTRPSINLETGTPEEEEINLLSTTLDANREILTIHVSSAIPDSSRLSLTKTIFPQIDTTGTVWLIGQSYGVILGLWVYNAYQPIIDEVTLSSPFSPAQATLSLRPFAPTDIDLFTPGVYTQASPMTPASGDTLTETTAQTALEIFLAKRITNTLQQTLSKFNDATLINKMPNPTLRAGLISLTGTLGESGIDAILRGPFG